MKLLSIPQATNGANSIFLDPINIALDIRRWSGSATSYGTAKISVVGNGDLVFYNGLQSTNIAASTEVLRIPYSTHNVLIGNATETSGGEKLQLIGQIGSGVALGLLGNISSDSCTVATDISSINFYSHVIGGNLVSSKILSRQKFSEHSYFTSDLVMQTMNYSGGALQDRILIKAITGNVLIGASIPTAGDEKLQVNGSASFAGDLLANSYCVNANASKGYGLWNNPAGNFGIRMADVATCGRMTGETTSDYNMYFAMTGGRGFIFENGFNGTKLFAINADKVRSAVPVAIQNGSLSLSVGADTLLNTLTNSTIKQGRIVTPNYNTAEEPMTVLVSQSDSALNIVSIGGGSDIANAATTLKFFTAINTNTLTGTMAAIIDAKGNMGIGTGTSLTSTYKLTVQNDDTVAGSAMAIWGTCRPTSSGADYKYGIYGECRIQPAYTGTGYLNGTTGSVIVSGTGHVGTITAMVGLRAFVATADGSDGAVTNAYGLQVATMSLGIGSTTTLANLVGIHVANQTSWGASATTVKALALEQAAGTNKWNISASGTAQNSIVGVLNIGHATEGTLHGCHIQKTLNSESISGLYVQAFHATGGITNAFGADIRAYSSHSSGTISGLVGLRVLARGQTTGGTINYLTAIQTQADISVGTPTVLNSRGLVVADMITGTTSIYGIKGEVSSGTAGTNKWNLFIDGSAPNCMAGRLLIGATSSADTTTKLQVTGDASISGAVTCSGTGAIKLPTGTTAQQPAVPTIGMTRFNTSSGMFEGYNGDAWVNLISAAPTAMGITNAVRQTVLSAPVNTSGDANFLTFSTTNFAFQNISSTNPLIITFASGFDGGGSVDFTKTINSNPSNIAYDVLNTYTVIPSGVPIQSTSYIYADRDASTGLVTYGTSKFPCWYGDDLVTNIVTDETIGCTVDITNVGGSITSSNASTSYPSNMFDSDVATYWASAETGTGVNGVSYFGMDFGAATALKKIVWYNSAAANSIGYATIQYWNDTSWVSLGTVSGTFDTATIYGVISAAVSGKSYVCIKNSSLAYTATKWRVLAGNDLGAGASWRITTARFYGVTTNQHYFELSTFRMYTWNGSATPTNISSWEQKQRVFLGEAGVTISDHTLATRGSTGEYNFAYAIRGKSKVNFTVLTPSFNVGTGHAANYVYTPQHKIGSLIPKVKLCFRFNGVDNGFLDGEEIQATPNFRNSYVDTNGVSTTTYSIDRQYHLIVDKTYIYYGSDVETSFETMQKTSAAGSAVAKANLDLVFYCERGW